MPYRDAAPTLGRCPRCTDEAASLRRLEAGSVSLDQCALCGGVWAGADALRAVAADIGLQKALLAEPRLRGLTADSVVAVACPICDAVLPPARFERANVSVHACDRHGAWFGPGALRAAVSHLWARPVEPARFVDLRSPDERTREDESVAGAPLVVRLLDRLLSL